MLFVGKMLGKSLAEVSVLPVSEINYWLAYAHYEKDIENKPIDEERGIVDITNSPEGLK